MQTVNSQSCNHQRWDQAESYHAKICYDDEETDDEACEKVWRYYRIKEDKRYLEVC